MCAAFPRHRVSQAPDAVLVWVDAPLPKRRERRAGGMPCCLRPQRSCWSSAGCRSVTQHAPLELQLALDESQTVHKPTLLVPKIPLSRGNLIPVKAGNRIPVEKLQMDGGISSAPCIDDLSATVIGSILGESCRVWPKEEKGAIIVVYTEQFWSLSCCFGDTSMSSATAPRHSDCGCPCINTVTPV